MRELITMFIVIALVVLGYFLSYQLQFVIAKFTMYISNKLGVYTSTREFALQRYTYLHRASLLTKAYTWVNEQLIASGMKKSGVTVVGYVSFWAGASLVMSVIITITTQIDIVSGAFLSVIIFFVCMVLTRVFVAEKMERREEAVMDAIDLIIPELQNGVKNSIAMYKDNFNPSLQGDFKAFLANIQDRGYSFADAMFILSDNLGIIFRDFAQKSVFYEALGEPDMVDIFTDIVETNRLRRELRYRNNIEFGVLKTSFLVSSLLTFGYFIFLMVTDRFSRYFFLTTGAGRVLLILILLVVFGVMSYITTIKSRAL